MNNNILDFYFSVIDLKTIKRSGWIELGIDNPESIMDHIGGTVLLAMSINEEKGLNLDMSKVYEMFVIKELKKTTKSPEELLNKLSNNSRLLEVYKEYKERTSREALFAYMVCKLESDIQAKKYELDGLLSIEAAKADIEDYPEEIKSRLTNISKASDGWLEYNRQYYDDMFLELSSDIQDK